MGQDFLTHVILSCGHKRRIEYLTENDEYYCMTCDTHGNTITKFLHTNKSVAQTQKGRNKNE
jgi:hypothetical protein